VLGLAVETARVRAILDSVERTGVRVGSICSTALLALAASRRPGAAAPDYAVLLADDATDVIRLSGGVPVRWYTVSAEPADWFRCLEVDLLTHPHDAAKPRVECIGAPGGKPAVPHDFKDGALSFERASDDPLVALAARAARQALRGQNPAWVDFHQGGLDVAGVWNRPGGPLWVAMAAGLILVAVLASTFIIRGRKYADIADIYVAHQTAEYRKVFPTGDLPGNLTSRLKSEASRLAALSGAGEKPPEQLSALDSLKQVVASLPPTLRLRLTEMRIGPAELIIDGEVRSHTDAQSLSQALKRAAFEMEPPHTVNLGTDDVSFSLTGRRNVPQPAARTPRVGG
jgi:hypothetical protein